MRYTKEEITNRSFFGDCLEVMPQFPSGVFDMILADLPYGTTSNKWDKIIPFELLWPMYLRLLKPSGAIVLTASQPFTSMLIMSQLKLFRDEWIWIKNRGGNFANTKRSPFKEHESVLMFSRGKWTFNKQYQERSISGLERVKYDITLKSDSSNYRPFKERKKIGSRMNKTDSTNYGKFNGKRHDNYDLRVPSSWQQFNTEVGLHSNQKPISLCQYFILTYSNPGDLILDNCAGSGTTGEAAFSLDRKYTLVESDRKHYNTILRREARFKNTLFN